MPPLEADNSHRKVSLIGAFDIHATDQVELPAWFVAWMLNQFGGSVSIGHQELRVLPNLYKDVGIEMLEIKGPGDKLYVVRIKQ